MLGPPPQLELRPELGPLLMLVLMLTLVLRLVPGLRLGLALVLKLMLQLMLGLKPELIIQRQLAPQPKLALELVGQLMAVVPLMPIEQQLHLLVELTQLIKLELDPPVAHLMLELE